MKFLVAMMILAIAAPAVALENPDVLIYLSFDLDDDVCTIAAPAPNSFFDVYLVIACFGEGGGTRGVGCYLTKDATLVAISTGGTNLLGGLTIGGPEDAVNGWALVAGADCAMPVGDIVVAGYASYLYVGGTGGIYLNTHPVANREVLDCDNLADNYCIMHHAGVGIDCPAGELDCECVPPTPVEDATWGGIKALYR